MMLLYLRWLRDSDQLRILFFWCAAFQVCDFELFSLLVNSFSTRWKKAHIELSLVGLVDEDLTVCTRDSKFKRENVMSAYAGCVIPQVHCSDLFINRILLHCYLKGLGTRVCWTFVMFHFRTLEMKCKPHKWRSSRRFGILVIILCSCWSEPTVLYYIDQCLVIGLIFAGLHVVVI